MSWNNENYDDYVSGHVADTGSAMPRKSIVESLMGSYDFNHAREEVTFLKIPKHATKKKKLDRQLLLYVSFGSLKTCSKWRENTELELNRTVCCLKLTELLTGLFTRFLNEGI